jgi:hypothetical protein
MLWVTHGGCMKWNAVTSSASCDRKNCFVLLDNPLRSGSRDWRKFGKSCFPNTWDLLRLWWSWTDMDILGAPVTLHGLWVALIEGVRITFVLSRPLMINERMWISSIRCNTRSQCYSFEISNQSKIFFISCLYYSPCFNAFLSRIN